MKKIMTYALTALLLICFCAQTLPVYAASPSFNMTDAENVGAEEEVKVTVKLEGSNISVGAFSFSMSYDATKLRYVTGSLESTYFDDISVYAKDGKLNFAWDSSKNVSVKTGSVFTVTFVTASDFAEDTIVEMTKGNVYKVGKDSSGNLAFDTVYEKTTSVTVSATIFASATQTIDTAVQAVIDKIDALPETVVATEEYKTALDEALNAYADLTYAQQKKVTNYEELVSKFNEYMGLTNNSLSQEAEEWLNNSEWAYAFELRDDTVSLADRDAIENAMEAWEQLSASAKYETTKERMLLKSLKGILDVLYAEELEKQEQEQLQADAAKYVEGYKTDWKAVLSLTPDMITSAHLEVITQAENALHSLQGLGAFDLAYNILMTDGTYDYLQTLKEKALEEYARENPEDAEYLLLAEKFRSQFGYVLGMDVEDITYEDVADIYAAYMAYDFLDATTKSYLESEYEKLEGLMAASESLSPESDEKVVTETVEKVVTETVEKTVTETVEKVITETEETTVTEEKLVEVIKMLSNPNNYDVTFKVRGISWFIWIFVALDIALLVMFIGTKVMFWVVRKKYKKYGLQEV